jgi:hypothetical protein
VVLAVALVAFAMVGLGCGEAVVTLAPTPAPTPVITPDPHLDDPTTADAVFLALGAAGLRVTANNAAAGEGDLVKRINATYLGWPLVVSEYTSSAALAEQPGWRPDPPAQGEAPVQIAGLNILIEWGPTTGAEPKRPSDPQLQGLRELATTLDALLSPLEARSVVPVPGAAAPARTADQEAEATPGS